MDSWFNSLSKEIVWFFLALFGIVVLLELLSTILRKILVGVKGKIGERRVAKIINKLDESEHKVLHDVLIKTSRGSTQIDHLVVSRRGIFVVETKNYQGWIFGNPKQATWTQSIWRAKNKFQNPIRQNYGHIMSIREHLPELSADVFKSIIVFTGRAQFKTERIDGVLYSDELFEAIMRPMGLLLSEQDRDSAYEKLIALNDPSKEARRQHVKDVKSRFRNSKKNPEVELCPKCGGDLIEHKGKYGPFRGCVNYPNCRFTCTNL